MSRRPDWVREGPDGLVLRAWVDRSADWRAVAAAFGAAGLGLVGGLLLGLPGWALAGVGGFAFGGVATAAAVWTAGRGSVRIDGAVLESQVAVRGQVVQREAWSLAELETVELLEEAGAWRLRLVHGDGREMELPLPVDARAREAAWLADRVRALAAEAEPVDDPGADEREAQEALEALRTDGVRP